MVHLQYSLAFLISPHGIAMPIKGLYFTSVVSIFFFLLSFFFSTLNLWGQWTDLNQMDTYSLMTAIWKIWSELPLAYSPHGLGQNRFFGTDFELWPNVSLQWNMTSTMGKKPVNPQGLPYMTHIWWILAPKGLRTAGEFLFTHP